MRKRLGTQRRVETPARKPPARWPGPEDFTYTPEDTSWRPRTPQIALNVLRNGVRFDFLDLNGTERALLRVLQNRGLLDRSADVLLASVGYRDPKQSRFDHLAALYSAVARLQDDLEVHPNLGPGRPSRCKPYRPVEWGWNLVLRWYLPWLFRKELDRFAHEPERCLSLDRLEAESHVEQAADAEYAIASPRGSAWRGKGKVPSSFDRGMLRTGNHNGVSAEMRKALRLRLPSNKLVNAPVPAHDIATIPPSKENEMNNMVATILERLDEHSEALARIELRQTMGGETLDKIREAVEPAVSADGEEIGVQVFAV